MNLISGDEMQIINNKDGDWWKAKLMSTGKIGFIPSNYVAEKQSIQAEEWFHGTIKRAEAEKILLSNGRHGDFLIRESESKPGDYSLSIREGDGVKHYRIRKLDDGGAPLNFLYSLLVTHQAFLFYFLHLYG